MADALIDDNPAQPAAQELDVVLTPLSEPALGEIVIGETLFAIGRNELPFSSYPAALSNRLSRRHARIFLEHGSAYIADLGSKNGTTVNGADIRQKTSLLQEGDEIVLGGALTYRVGLRRSARRPAQAAAPNSLTLTPQQLESGLQAIVVTAFPFLVGKTEAAFAQYRDSHPRQLDYLSRRHAHIFLRGGAPFVEDLGSTNGTFVNGARLDEHARRLDDGDLLAFGGTHFVYTTSIERPGSAAGAGSLEPTVTMLAPQGLTAASSSAAASTPASSPSLPSAAPEGDAERTTFVAAAESFLNIFCSPVAEQQPPDAAAEPAAHAGPQPGADGRRRSRIGHLAAGMAAALCEDAPRKGRRPLLWFTALAIAGGIALAVLLSREGPEQQVRDLLAGGDPARAAALASAELQRHPANAPLAAMATEAALKAHVPPWLASLKRADFDGADAALARLAGAAAGNPDLRAMAAELGWIDKLERYMAPRAAADAPIRIYADEQQMQSLLQWWNDDTAAHQRLLSRVASLVPEFGDTYAAALSHLRRLQSDDAVYMAAIERLKASIAAELGRDRPDAIEPLLAEAQQKYPRLGGLDAVRDDLQLYQRIQDAAHRRQLGPLAALLASARFATPLFQAKYQSLAAGGALPPPEVQKAYGPVAAAWQAGRAEEAYAALAKLANGPWAAQAAAELARKKSVMAQFSALQKTRGSPGQDERVLAFYASLDPLDDRYFVRAAEQDLQLDRAAASRQAQQDMARAETLWRQYRDGGGIEGRQRLEAAVSERFRSQAGLLAAAQEAAQQGRRRAGQLRLPIPEPWRRTEQEILAEARLQRALLQEARGTLEPGVLRAKLTLLGGQDNGERRNTETAR
ncbi:FHA domain-containing protein [Noviherbaspirillum sp. 1P10PC]|uniref:FHA domain-containing protein n=1 Tax=Noviherbaspirillum sp. 1P10PC TaxID=3132292 RepID=UPI0039A3446C